MTQIEHPDIARFTTIRTDYAALVDRDHCAAMLLSILEGWTNWLRERGRSLWVEMSGVELSEAVSGLFSRKTFMAAGRTLEELGLLVRKQKRACDRTYQYLLQVGALQERLNLLVFWNTACTLFQLISSASTSLWMRFGRRWLKSLLEANVPSRTLEESDVSQCKMPAGTTFKYINNNFSNNTTTNKAVVVSSGDKGVLEKTTPEQSAASLREKAQERVNLPEQPKVQVQVELSEEQAEAQEPVEFPQQQKLESNRVNVQDKGLQKVAWKYKERLATAVAAWLEWAARTSIEKPTRSLAQAIKEDWQPETQVLSPQEKTSAIVEETDWTSHPEWENWLEQMRESVSRFVALGTSFDMKTRRAIANWADTRKLIWEPIGLR